MSGALGYDEAMRALKRAALFGINPSLEGVTELVEALGRPQDAFASVQVGGTNGKTSTARITAALLRGEGVRTGLYTSPELERYPERVEIDGVVASDADIARALEATFEAAQRLRGTDAVGGAGGFTEFELTTAAALWLFRNAGVEVAVLEVGLGGRWDATSVVTPQVAVITGIGLDHTAILGDTLEAIAEDKAAIAKPASIAVLGPGTAGLEQIFLARADAVGATARAVRAEGEATPVSEDATTRFRLAAAPDRPGGATAVDVWSPAGRLESLALTGPSYQVANIATGVAAAEAVLSRALDPGSARRALAALAIPGRFELVREQPPVVVDGAHNPQAAAVLAQAIAEAFPAEKPLVLLGVLADKDARGIVEAIESVAGAFAVTSPESPRALPAADLAAIVGEVTGARPRTFERLRQALDSLVSDGSGPLVVTGSLTTAGQARRALRDGS